MAFKQISPADIEKISNSLSKVEKVILETLNYEQVIQKVVDSILFELDYLDIGYRIVVLGLINKDRHVLERVSISQTPDAVKAVSGLPMPFGQADVPLSATQNYCVKVITDKQPLITNDWANILSPPLSVENARMLQQSVGIKTSMVFPLLVRNVGIGMMIFSVVKDASEISQQEKWLITRFTDIVALAVQNARLYSNLAQITANLNLANQRLRELDKLKDDFVSLASHELRTPMTAIKSYVWMVLNDKAGPITDKTREHLNRVFNSTERLIHLVSEMLDISRIESGRVTLKPETFSMVDLAHDIQTEFQARSAEQRLTLNVDASDDLPQITADRERIHQVLENLVGNAYKFTAQGGQVTIRLRKVADNLETSITDTGTGIDPADQARLFEKFGRSTNSLITPAGTGSGLGLYICKQYVELHHGKVWLVSTPGQGSTFTFSLPLNPPPTTPPEQ